MTTEDEVGKLLAADALVRAQAREFGAVAGAFYAEDSEACWELYLEQRVPGAEDQLGGGVVHPLKIAKCPKKARHAEYWPGPHESDLIELALNLAPRLARQVESLDRMAKKDEQRILELTVMNADLKADRDRAQQAFDTLTEAVNPWVEQAQKHAFAGWDEASRITGERDEALRQVAELRAQLEQERLAKCELEASLAELRQDAAEIIDEMLERALP